MRHVGRSVLASTAALLLARSAPAQAPTTQTATTAMAPLSLADSLVGAAKEDYLAARLLYAQGDYAQALVRFERAYRASPDPRLLWNAAVCQKDMGHYVNAISLVRRYLDSGSPLVTPEAARNGQTFIAAAESRTARLDVGSNESDATVYVDGALVGSTPLRQALAVDQGVHKVAVKKNGFAEFSTEIAVTDAANVHVEAQLGSLAHDGRVAIHARPGDAIAVDGRFVAGETWEGTLPTGTHAVRVTAPASRPFQADVLVRDGETQTLDVKLEPARGGPVVPAWAWIVGGTVLAAGATTAGYFLFKSAGDSAIPMEGSIATVRTPLH